MTRREENMSGTTIQDIHEMIDRTVSSPLSEEVRDESEELFRELLDVLNHHTHHAVTLAAIAILFEEISLWKLFRAQLN